MVSENTNQHEKILMRIVSIFDRDETAGEFLSQDGDGGFGGAIYRMAREIDRLRSLTAAEQAEPAKDAEPNFATSIAHVVDEEVKGGAACGWISCSGCHETNEGYETGHYPYSRMFGCYVGSGCSECGGLGVVWEHWDTRILGAIEQETSFSPQPDSRLREAEKLLAELSDIEAGSRGEGPRAYYWDDKPHRELWRAIEIARAALAQGADDELA